MSLRSVFLMSNLLFFVILLYTWTVSCSAQDICTEGSLSNHSLDPNGGKCTKNCECNNLNYWGYCNKGACLSYLRGECPQREMRRPCIVPKESGSTCPQGVQVCQPALLTVKKWGACTPDCSCQAKTQINCFTGSLETLNRGICKAGLKVCQKDLTWGTCQGEVTPREEICNGLDDNCNGKVDDGNFASVIEIAGDFGKKPGYKDGKRGLAQFQSPSHVLFDGKGNLYVTDKGNHCIRKIDKDGNVTTYAGDPGKKGFINGDKLKEAVFWEPAKTTLGPKGSLYVLDQGNHCIRKIEAKGIVSTFAGACGFASAGYLDSSDKSKVKFDRPTAMVFDTTGNAYITDRDNHVIRKIDTKGNVTTIAGTAENAGFRDGIGSQAKFSGPTGLALTKDGILYIADKGNNVIRKLNLKTQEVTSVTPNKTGGYTNGPLLNASFQEPTDLVLDADGNLLISDQENHAIRKLDFKTGQVTTVLGKRDKPGLGSTKGDLCTARLRNPSGVSYDAAQRTLFIADRSNNAIRSIKLEK